MIKNLVTLQSKNQRRRRRLEEIFACWMNVRKHKRNKNKRPRKRQTKKTWYSFVAKTKLWRYLRLFTISFVVPRDTCLDFNCPPSEMVLYKLLIYAIWSFAHFSHTSSSLSYWKISYQRQCQWSHLGWKVSRGLSTDSACRKFISRCRHLFIKRKHEYT